MRKSVLTFKDAYGLYWYDRYKPLFESAINLVASIVLAIPFGIAGILLGTLISTVTTCFWIEPYVLFKYGLKQPVRTYFVDYGKNTLITLISGAVTWRVCSFIPNAGILAFAEKAAVCALSANIVFAAAYCRTEEIRYFGALVKTILKKLHR